MRKYPARNFSSGLIQTLPLLVVALLIIMGSLALNSGRGRGNPPRGVLSESESGGGSSGKSGSGESNTSGSTSGTSGGSSGETKTGSSGSSTSPSATPKVEIRKVETEVENETPEPQEFENETEFEVAEGTEEAKIKIASREGRFRFFERRFGAETEFPVSVNKTTHELTITTPAGVRTVAILPDSAVENMLAENVIDRVLGVNGQIVEVKVGPDGTLIYEIQGAKDEKFLGLLGVAIPRTLEVSTQNGQLLTVNQSLIDRFLDLISF